MLVITQIEIMNRNISIISFNSTLEWNMDQKCLKWDAAIINLIIKTCAFTTITSQIVRHEKGLSVDLLSSTSDS